jgi:hypothetical protein
VVDMTEVRICNRAIGLLVIADDTEPDQVQAAINELRARQRAACIASTRDEIGDAIDELLELLPRDH